jgi:hypothetical protein
MPGGDRTGPFGQGPMTGRAMGYCAMRVPRDETTKTSQTSTEVERPSPALSRWGYGAGFGWRCRWIDDERCRPRWGSRGRGGGSRWRHLPYP